MKVPDWLRQLLTATLTVAKNASAILKAITLIGVAGTAILQYFTGFFTLKFMVPLWLLILLPVLGILVCSLFTFFKNRRLHVCKFAHGDQVIIKSNRRSIYLVSEYLYYNYTRVKLIDPSQPANTPIIMDEALLEHYNESMIPYQGVYLSKPRRENYF